MSRSNKQSTNSHQCIVCQSIFQTQHAYKGRNPKCSACRSLISIDLSELARIKPYGTNWILNISAVTDNINTTCGPSTRVHNSGWKISGVICQDYYVWVNHFVAEHDVYGTVVGDFDKAVYASSQEAYDNFIKNHQPEPFDYNDI